MNARHYVNESRFQDEESVVASLAPLILVGGKGGVGKSFVAARCARLLAQPLDRDRGGGRVARPRVALVGFGNDAPPESPECGERFDRIVLEPEAALGEQAARIIGSATLSALVFNNSAIKTALKLVPGIHEVALLLALDELANRYDHVVADLPASGHGASWLRSPQTLLRIVDGGRAKHLTESLVTRLQDPRRTSFVLVTTTEPFVLTEAHQLATELTHDAGVPMAAVVVNRLLPLVSTAYRAAESLASSSHVLADDAAELQATLRDRAARQSAATETLRRFSASVPLVGLPEAFGTPLPLGVPKAA